MGKWAERAMEIEEAGLCANSVSSAKSSTIGTNGTIGMASVRLKQWHQHLSALDDCTAPEGFTLNRWQMLCDDACWIYEGFASQAVRDGWTAQSLFGFMSGKPGYGGLADRLQSSRSLKMMDGYAFWSTFGLKRSMTRECWPDLTLLWEADR